MSRVRVSTTVSEELLSQARAACSGLNDAKLLDQALETLVARYHSAEIDRAYSQAYSKHPIDETDEWGDLASFRSTAGRS